jgi:hypothetical protein
VVRVSRRSDEQKQAETISTKIQDIEDLLDALESAKDNLEFHFTFYSKELWSNDHNLQLNEGAVITEDEKNKILQGRDGSATPEAQNKRLAEVGETLVANSYFAKNIGPTHMKMLKEDVSQAHTCIINQIKNGLDCSPENIEKLKIELVQCKIARDLSNFDQTFAQEEKAERQEKGKNKRKDIISKQWFVTILKGKGTGDFKFKEKSLKNLFDIVKEDKNGDSIRALKDAVVKKLDRLPKQVGIFSKSHRDSKKIKFYEAIRDAEPSYSGIKQAVEIKFGLRTPPPDNGAEGPGSGSTSVSL